MSATVAVFREASHPRGYAIFRVLGQVVGGVECGEMIPWRVARRSFEPEAYHAMVTASFSDWCRRNGYPEADPCSSG